MFFFLPRSHKKQLLILITRGALRAARVKKRVGYLFRRRRVFIFLRRSQKMVMTELIEPGLKSD